uniref:Arm_2 domain-containing protein n=1 Tax=Caenorhabditis tropicalis TaxID=1561998 RepID=A0A1I7T716_9PELO
MFSANVFSDALFVQKFELWRETATLENIRQSCMESMFQIQTPHYISQIQKFFLPSINQPNFLISERACPVRGCLDSYGPDEQIELARESGVLSHVVALFREPESLVAPALRTLGNVATGNDALTQAVIDLGALNEILPLMEKSLPVLINVLKSGDHKCQFEASWALSNLAQGGTSRQIAALVEYNAVPALCAALNQTNTDMLNNTLETLYAIMVTIQNSYPNQMDHLHEQVEELGGLDALERLQKSQSEAVYTQAYRIITEFFSDEAAADANNAENADPGSPWNF